MPETPCPICKGSRYVLDRINDRSVARVCNCNVDCRICGGLGHVDVVQNGYSFVKPCECRAVDQRVARFNAAKLPARCGVAFEEFMPRNDDQQMALQVAITTAKKYRPNAPSKGFIVAGPVGAGKTHLLCATLRYLTLELGVSARYVEISFLFSEIRKGFSENRNGLDAILPLVDADVLAIDELGKGRGNPFEMDTLDELIARRYNSNRTTLIATNYSLAEERKAGGYRTYSEQTVAEKERPGDILLRDRVGERIFSRLHEMCHLVQLPLTTPDHRRR